ncbi:MAG TPA: DUF2470 domain-containing protein [Mycobacterium sp.]
MTSATLSTPTTAERVRSACVCATAAILAADCVPPATAPMHHLLADGSFALTVPSDSPMADASAGAGTAGIAAVLELTDHAPLPLREPVRSLVWIRGRIHSVPPHALRELLDLVAAVRPDPALLEVGAGQTLLLLGVDSVGLADLLTAAPDPFCEVESAWLRHLDSDRPEVVARLADKLPAGLRRGRVRPLGLDRYGMRLRVECADGDHDVRLPFPAPVHDVGGLGRAIRILMGCPFVNGLRARRQ